MIENLQPITDEETLANITKFWIASALAILLSGITVYLLGSLDTPYRYISIPVLILAGAFGYAAIRYAADDEAAS